MDWSGEELDRTVASRLPRTADKLWREGAREIHASVLKVMLEFDRAEQARALANEPEAGGP